MKYYKKLLELAIFSFNDLVKLIGNKETASTLVKDYQEKGYIKRIKRNLYTTINLETKEPVVNKFEIASNITDTSYISHHSAFEYHGFMNQVFYQVYVSTESQFKKFEFNGIEYIYISSNFREGVVPSNYNNKIMVTDVERTVLDAINDFEKIGGLEELFKCLELITFLNHKKLQKYLPCYNSQYMYQKAGFILELFKNSLQLPESFFDLCRNKIGKSTRYLYESVKNKNNHYNNIWQLIIPDDIEEMLYSEGDTFV